MPKLIALAIIPALWVALWADLAASEVISACLRGNTGQIIKAQIGGKPTHPCIGWQKPIQIPLYSVEPSPAELRLGIVLDMPVTTEFKLVLGDNPDHLYDDVVKVSGGTLSLQCIADSNGQGGIVTVLGWFFWADKPGGTMVVDGEPGRSIANMPTVDPSLIDSQRNMNAANPTAHILPEAYFVSPDGSEIHLESGQATLNGADDLCEAEGRVTYRSASP